MNIDWKKECLNTTSALQAAVEIQMATFDMLIKARAINKKTAYKILDKIVKRKKLKNNEFAPNVIQLYQDFLDGKVDPTEPSIDMANVIKFPSKKK